MFIYLLVQTRFRFLIAKYFFSIFKKAANSLFLKK